MGWVKVAIRYETQPSFSENLQFRPIKKFLHTSLYRSLCRLFSKFSNLRLGFRVVQKSCITFSQSSKKFDTKKVSRIILVAEKTGQVKNMGGENRVGEKYDPDFSRLTQI